LVHAFGFLAFWHLVKNAESETSRKRFPDKMAGYKCTTVTDKQPQEVNIKPLFFILLLL